MNNLRFHRSLRTLVFLLAAPALLSACGQYGDLYLPENKPADREKPAQPPAATPVDPQGPQTGEE